jgi:hypothetical protein
LSVVATVHPAVDLDVLWVQILLLLGIVLVLTVMAVLLPVLLAWALAGAPRTAADHGARDSGGSGQRLQLAWGGGGGQRPAHLFLVLVFVWCAGLRGPCI